MHNRRAALAILIFRKDFVFNFNCCTQTRIVCNTDKRGHPTPFLNYLHRFSKFQSPFVYWGEEGSQKRRGSSVAVDSILVLLGKGKKWRRGLGKPRKASHLFICRILMATVKL